MGKAGEYKKNLEQVILNYIWHELNPLLTLPGI